MYTLMLHLGNELCTSSQEFEDLVEPLVVKVNIMSQTPEQEGHLLGLCLSVFSLPVCLFVCLFACQSVSLSVSLSLSPTS